MTAGRSAERFERVVLESEAIRLIAVPALGARVVSLVDRRTRREWLVSGEGPADRRAAAAWASPQAAFGGNIASGWDECLPSVAPADDPTGLAARLRDHGDAWGRPARVTVDGASLTAVSDGVHWPYAFTRRLAVVDDSVDIDYEIENRAVRDLPFLWSMHPLLDMPEASQIYLPGIDEVAVSHAAGLRLRRPADALRLASAADLVQLPSDGLAWPVAEVADGPFALDRTLGPDAGIALKLYAQAPHGGRAAAQTPNGEWLGFAWDPGAIPFVGVWLDYGGWPERAPVNQIAIEPTTAPADDLPGAMRVGRAVALPPGGRFEWSVRLRLGLGAALLEAFLRG